MSKQFTYTTQHQLLQICKENIEILRNEFEYYQDNGSLEFGPKKDILIKTTNSDSLELVFKENPVNISGIISSNGNETIKIYVSVKYRIEINKLNIKRTLITKHLYGRNDPT